MIDVVVVSCDETKGIFYLSPNSLELKKGDYVIFETENGLLTGHICKEIYKEKEKNLVLPLFKVQRILNKNDIKQYEQNKIEALEALEYAKKINKKLELNMNFIDAYYYFDRSQLLFYFLADERVDVRELAKRLAAIYKTRIELRQIGIRDKAKEIGGLGPCGRFLCCNSFLTDFNSVSINMAKNQMLALNPSKINGICGRLLCCLGYENETYTDLKKELPTVGLVVDTPLGMGKTVSIDVFKQTYQVDLKEKGIISFSKEDKK